MKISDMAYALYLNTAIDELLADSNNHADIKKDWRTAISTRIAVSPDLREFMDKLPRTSLTVMSKMFNHLMEHGGRLEMVADEKGGTTLFGPNISAKADPGGDPVPTIVICRRTRGVKGSCKWFPEK